MHLRILAVSAILACPILTNAQPTDVLAIQRMDREVVDLRSQGKTSSATEAAQRLVDLSERILPPTSGTLALSLIRLAQVYEDAGRLDDAEGLLRRAIAIMNTNQYANPNPTAAAMVGLGNLEFQQGRASDAERTYEKALALLTDFADPNKAILTRVRYELGVLYAWGPRPQRAEPLLRAAYDGLVADGKGISAESALIFRSMARAKQGSGDYLHAAELYEQAVEIALRAKGEDAPLTANIRHDMATNWVKAGTPSKGTEAQKKALAVLDGGSSGISQLNLATVLTTMALIQVASRELDGALVNATRALDIRTRLLGESNRTTEESVKLLAEIETKRGRPTEAARFTAKAKAIHSAAEAEASRSPVVKPTAAEGGLRPAYPLEAKRFGLEGKTVVRAMVRSDGTAAFARLAESSGYRSLDDAAIRAVLGAKFNPGRNASGQAVGGELLVPINFVLTPTDRVVEPQPSYGMRLTAAIRKELVYPDIDAIQGNPASIVMVYMATDGAITGRTLQETSGVPAWDAAVLAAIDKAGRLPVDTDGFAPQQMALHVRPKR